MSNTTTATPTITPTNATKPLTPEYLDLVHRNMRSMALLWIGRMVTDKEIADAFRVFADCNFADPAAIHDLLDPNTGLRYGALKTL